MNVIRNTWRRGRSGKLVVGLGALATSCIICSCIALAFPSGRQSASATPAAQLAIAVTFAASPTAEATPTTKSTEPPTAAPTDVPEQPTATPVASATKPSLPTAEVSNASGGAVETPTPDLVVELMPASTDGPAVVVNLADLTPTFDDGVGGDNANVDPAWWPCKEGQIKGNINSDIYHVPTGRDYAKTWRNVACFDSEQDAQDHGFRAAKR